MNVVDKAARSRGDDLLHDFMSHNAVTLHHRIPIGSERTELERAGRFAAYEPNFGILPSLRALLESGDEAVRELALDTATRFMRHYGLTAAFPRHDFMDHNLPFAMPLNTSQIHETLADLVKRATLDVIRGIDEAFPYDLLDRTLMARLEFDGYDFYEDLEYLYEFGPKAWQAAMDFYRELGPASAQRVWVIGCRLHYEMRGLPYRDDYFGGDPPPAESESRCG